MNTFFSLTSLRQVRTKLIEIPHILCICGIRVKIEGLPKFNLLSFLNFTTSMYGFLFFVSNDLDILCYLR